MTRTIYFDMDGTFVNLYGVENWLDMLINEDTTPYEIAKPLFRMCDFARTIHKVQKIGIKVGIVSWTAKGTTKEYDERVANAKREWLAKHLPSVQFDEIHILKYGTNKNIVNKGMDILFDDEIQNRENWTGIAYNVENVCKTMRMYTM